MGRTGSLGDWGPQRGGPQGPSACCSPWHVSLPLASMPVLMLQPYLLSVLATKCVQGADAGVGCSHALAPPLTPASSKLSNQLPGRSSGLSNHRQPRGRQLLTSLLTPPLLFNSLNFPLFKFTIALSSAMLLSASHVCPSYLTALP